ncbi:deoxyuridine 5'-triphosphate nucleotidohydrolase-like [Aphelocoma coerulescens]|uniref:deoxyuridine 5'-triphosphate nucleotidohydrolase-like n=1 Tax=Aphelocoma coerulescens TaxID=39617 RepID=UPI003604C8D3
MPPCGKQRAQHGGVSRQDRNERPKEPRVECNPGGFLHQNQPATQGSLGVDVATSIEVTLTDRQVTLIPTTAKGPLSSDGPHLGGLLVGRSSTSWQGVVVLPGVIDADYTGEIKIMAYALQPPVTIPQGSCIAQIVPILLMTNGGTSNNHVRGDLRFGSSGFDVFWTLNLA